MRNRILGITYIVLFILLIITVIAVWRDKGSKVLWGALILAFFYLLPAILERVLKISIPPMLKYLVFIFLFLCIDLGGILSFFQKYYYWDNLVHFVSGILSSTLALSILIILNRNSLTANAFRPGFAAFFSFIFAMAVGLSWEYLEFISDTFFGTNHMSDTLLNNGTIDIGLLDTFSDLLTSQAAALFMAVFYYHAIKTDRLFKLSRVLIQPGR